MSLSSSIRSRLEFQHQTIEELIKGYSEEQLKMRPLADKWSVFENIAHLCNYQLAFTQRIEKILEGTNPLFSQYVAENDPLFSRYLELPLPNLITKLNTDRKEIYQQLNELRPDQLSLKGVHPRYSELTLVQWSEFFLLHEAHHLFTIFKLLNLSVEGSR
jgi:hypothetical protein